MGLNQNAGISHMVSDPGKQQMSLNQNLESVNRVVGSKTSKAGSMTLRNRGRQKQLTRGEKMENINGYQPVEEKNKWKQKEAEQDAYEIDQSTIFPLALSDILI